jgi:hypothetical protein
MWEKHPDFFSMVEQEWNTEGKACTVHDLLNKMGKLTKVLGEWNTNIFGSVKKELRRLRDELAQLRDDPVRLEPSYEEKKTVERIVELENREETMWRQRSRVQWLAEGDRNTHFFHRRASARKQKNKVTQLTKPDGSITEDPAEMGALTTDFYSNLYESEGVQDMNVVLDTVPRKVSGDMNRSLTKQFSAQEVKEALFQMFPTKSPGPDGFPAHFFQRHWSLCGEEVTAAVIRILEGVDDPTEVNRTFIVMIPKVASPSDLGQFRPISLCNVLAKIASKVLANRLKQILPEIISVEQSAFVPGCLITDNIIAAYECLHFMKRRKSKSNPYCALKLDMRKAYDRVEWTYMRAIMSKLGFWQNWIDMVMRMVSSVSFSVLFNGSPLERFKPTRGIRQGDPISPYLFLIAAEGLSCLLKHRSQSSNIEGIKVAPSAPAVNHLLFADDSLLLFKASEGGAREIEDALHAYCMASGQRINRDKSSVYFSKGCPNNVRLKVMDILEVSNESLNDKYLGMPSDVGRSRNGSFKFLKDRLWKRVQGWLEQLLSAGGKEILIKSVAQAVATYSMSCFRLPRGLCIHLNSLMRNFWWGSKGGKRKTCWVSWEVMTSPKYMGGLGFRDIELFNLALLAKQAWRVLQVPESLSARLLKSVYFPNGDLLSASLGNHPSQIWRSIMDGVDVLKQGLIKRVGTGVSIHPWNDNWLPRDFLLRPVACPKEDPPSQVSYFIDSVSATWNEQRLRECFVQMDIEVIRNIPLSTTQDDDVWAWHYDRKGCFSVKSAYRMLAETKQRREDWLDGKAANSNSEQQKKQWTSIWKIQVPSKLKVFLWRLARQSLPTADTRHRRNMAPTPWCGICRAAVDTWRHALLDCTMSRCVWALCDEQIVEHISMINEDNAKLWIFEVMNSISKKEFIKVLVTMWAIWFARRKVIFDEEYQSPLSTYCFINNFLEDMERLEQVQPVKQKQPKPSCSKWIAPPENMVKVNVDAAVAKTSDKGAVAAVARESNGRFIGCSILTVEGLTDPAILESMACREALALSSDLNVNRIKVATDCLEVANSLCSSEFD